ncbi:MAG TPA: hypothetical protein VF245_04485 [Solirubrobacterales bacterium]
MKSESYLSLPSELISAFFSLIIVGIVLGVLYGAELLSGVALTWIVLGGSAIFVIWAVVKLDPRGITELSKDWSKDEEGRK